MPKAKAESFTAYLRRVGNDHAASGAEFTAEDYRDAAFKIDVLEKANRDLLARAERAERALAKAQRGRR